MLMRGDLPTGSIPDPAPESPLPGAPETEAPAPGAPETEAGASSPEAQPDAHARSERAPVWVTVVHDDPVTLMDYVVWVLEDYFGMPTARAQQLMWEVHTRGRAVVSRGAREKMETDAGAMHVYGLIATIEEEA